jgi:signal peptidase II
MGQVFREDGDWILKRYIRDYVFLFGITTFIVLLDQWSKFQVRTQLMVGEVWAPWDWLLPYMRIVHAINSGAAFGMFQGMAGIFTVLALVVAVVIVYYFPKVPREDWLLRLAMALQLGGALGNLVDRLQHGGFVTDFISVGTFPVFNVADASISIGVALMVFAMWFKEGGKKPAGDISDLDKGDPQVPEDMRGD